MSKYPELVGEMLRRGLTDTEVEKIIGGNLLRVWGDVDAVAGNMQARHQKSVQDRLPWLKRPGEPKEGSRSDQGGMRDSIWECVVINAFYFYLLSSLSCLY